MTDLRQNRLERYETWANECELLARLTTDRSKRAHYEQLAAHYRYLADSFRDALELHRAALSRLILH